MKSAVSGGARLSGSFALAADRYYGRAKAFYHASRAAYYSNFAADARQTFKPQGELP